MAFEDLYQEVILDHYRNPRNKEAIPDGISKTHENPSCGDSLRVAVTLGSDGRVSAVRFDGSGCAISMASASMMTEYLAHRTHAEALAETEAMISRMRGEGAGLSGFGDLECLSHVARFPMRVKCATLAWHAARDALQADMSRSQTIAPP